MFQGFVFMRVMTVGVCVIDVEQCLYELMQVLNIILSYPRWWGQGWDEAHISFESLFLVISPMLIKLDKLF